MLVTGAFFWQIVLAIHIAVVVAAFGVLVSYPLVAAAAERVDRRTVPVLLRVRVLIGRSLVNPGLLLVVLAGVYLASDLHQWSQFYVQWGIGAVIVIGALEGAFVIRNSGKLAVLAQRDVDAAGVGDVKWSEDYIATRVWVDRVNALLALIVIITIYVMTVQ